MTDPTMSEGPGPVVGSDALVGAATARVEGDHIVGMGFAKTTRAEEVLLALVHLQQEGEVALSDAVVVWKDDDRLIARIWFHLSTGNSSTGATNWMPALFTRMSQPPAFSTSARHSSPLDMSA